MNPWILFSFAVLYFALLFGIALYGDSRTGRRVTRSRGKLIYALSLAVYCTSWTFYGAVGTAANDGWSFLPIYLGPLLVFVFGHSLLQKMIRVGKRQNTTSVADFLASRYGKRQGIALLSTLICTVAGIPYIALQLKAVTNSITVLSASSPTPGLPIPDTALVVAVSMMAFAILFGTRQVDVSKHHPGMMLTIAFESLVKLAALIMLALYVIFVFYSGPAEFASELVASEAFGWSGISMNFLTQLLLAAAAVLVLPRQFHVMVVENTQLDHLNTARWVFPLYLILISLVVFPIASAGLRLFHGTGIDADTFVLLLPLAGGQNWLTILVFIGGFSASMAMIVITTLTLSTMLSNDAFVPFLLRHRLSTSSDVVAPWLLLARRAIIVGVILIAWLYNQLFGETEALSAIGLLAFSLVVQLLPALIGGLYWRRAHTHGAYAGMIAGSLLWFWTLIVPMLSHAGFISNQVLLNGPLGISWLRPEFLFGFEFGDPLSRGVFFSLASNIAAFVFFSRRAQPSLADRLQASAYVQFNEHLHSDDSRNRSKPQVKIGELISMLERFAGSNQTQRWIDDFERVNHLRLQQNDIPTADFIRYIERTLSGVIGASSARAMMHSALAGRELHLEDVVTFFDEATQAIQFNQKVLSSTLENLDHGVSVIDRDLKLVAWNRKYLEMYDYPKDMIRVGQSIDVLVRYNAERGECGPGNVEEHIQKRLNHLRSGSSHRFIRVRNNGRVTEIRGNPLPGGGFVTTFNDITEFVRAQDELKEAKSTLEARVAERTEEVGKINQELRAEIAERERAESMIMEAKTEAELANESKTRFLALASHDILQPLNAARLYNTALMDQWPDNAILPKLESSLRTTEELISTLLEIAKLDGTTQAPVYEAVDLKTLFASINDEFSAVAAEKSLRLIVRPTTVMVRSEARQLRRVIQNMVSNAIKYTRQGGILLAARTRGDQILIQVWDTGLGISEDDFDRIFLDFNRLDQHQQEAQGVGLGLSVVSRISQHLNHPLKVASKPGRGSCFSVTAPFAGNRDEKVRASDTPVKAANQLEIRVLVVDNDRQNTDALRTVLQGWGCDVETASTAAEARAAAEPQLLIIDYHLGESLTGFDLYRTLQTQWQNPVPAILVTAHGDADLQQAAANAGMGYLAKPVKPIALRSLIKNRMR